MANYAVRSCLAVAISILDVAAMMLLMIVDTSEAAPLTSQAPLRPVAAPPTSGKNARLVDNNTRFADSTRDIKGLTQDEWFMGITREFRGLREELRKVDSRFDYLFDFLYFFGDKHEELFTELIREVKEQNEQNKEQFAIETGLTSEVENIYYWLRVDFVLGVVAIVMIVLIVLTWCGILHLKY